MSRFTKQQLLEGLQRLRPDVQEIVLSVEHSDAFHEIMKKHGLTVAQIAAVSDAVAPVTFGLMLPQELPSELRRNLPMLDSAKIDALVADINTTMLAPIRTHVMEAAHQTKPPLSSVISKEPVAAVIHQAPLPSAPVSRTLGADMVNIKTAGTFRLASDSVTVTLPSSTPSPTIPKPAPIAPIRDGKYASVDPYREPTE